MKKIVSLLVIFLCLTSLFAGGKREKEDRDVTKLDSWQETFDINEKKPGKYNIVVTATDIGGNQTLAGPMNIFIDPDSDLPICSITNPRQNMSLPGNLNIVGTCVDDDAVERVEIILDEDTENPLICEGKEFWSYYLDTNNLAEGRHTLSVYGVDVNGVVGNSQKVVWHLNRRNPVTEVQSHSMGMLVSGKQKIKGLVKDGNGIASLAFSTDAGNTFVPVKIDNIKGTQDYSFEYDLDTTKLKDGPQVSWFKAFDSMGSVGLYSFLFFVDNTKPDVQIISPSEDEYVNGRFTVAGFAKDIIGMESLTWQFGEQSGDIELIPGNPFFTVDCDIRGQTIKSCEFKIQGVDIAKNISTVVKKILVNQDLDKSNITITSPNLQNNEVIFGDIFLNGLALDDDGVAEVYYSVDNGEVNTIVTDGAFMATIVELSAGPHEIKVWAKDIDDILGNVTTLNFVSSGKAPTFKTVEVVSSVATEPYIPGININPESNAIIKTSIDSLCGIKSLTWQFAGDEAKSMELKEAVKGSLPVSIPVNPTRWGYVELTIIATDIYDRSVKYCMPLYLTNLTKTRGQRGVYFTDNTINEDGLIIFEQDVPVYGYFVGDNPVSVKFVPETQYGSVRLEGNSILVTPGTIYGTSSNVKVEVTTNKGIKYLSRDLQLCLPAPKPNLVINDTSVRDGFSVVNVTGTIQTPVNVQNIKAYILSLASVGVTQKVEVSSDFVKLQDKTFEISCPGELFNSGMSVVEVVVTDDSNNKASNGVIVNKVTPDTTKNAAKPVAYWLEGEDIYCVANSPGGFDGSCVILADGQELAQSENVCYTQFGGRIKRDSLKPGQTSLEFSTSAMVMGKSKVISAKHTGTKDGSVKMYFASVNDNPYKSGMEVILPPLGAVSKEVTDKVIIQLESDIAVTAVDCEINGKPTKATLQKKEGSRVYLAELLLANIPAELTTIKATASLASSQTVSINGTISVIRRKDLTQINDSEKVWWTADTDSSGIYTIDSSNPLKAVLPAYGNFKTPLRVDFVNPIEGLKVEEQGNGIHIVGLKTGSYANVALKIQDAEGINYTSDTINIRVDNEAPIIDWKIPQQQIWVQKDLEITGSVTEDVDILKAAWAIASSEGIENWVGLNFAEKNKNTREFSNKIDLSNVADGLVTIKIEVTDVAGKTTRMQKVVHKDTTAPDVRVVLPENGVTVNGETRIVFDVKDAGKLVKAECVGFAEDGKTPIKYPMEFTPLITTMVGTKTQPIDDSMTFEFTDIAGNVAIKNSWDFVVDSKSDLPISEIHVPEEMQIITTDFVISGVVYDDDGESKIWYKIDDGEFKSLEGYGSSYSIPVPLKSMTDNEHTVTVYAEDIRGVKGEEVVRTFRISLEEPKGEVLKPAVEETVKDVITLSGVTSDKNGIEKVQVSIDNGNTYITAKGTEEWSYTFDTHILQDGTHVVFLKVWDKYGIQGLYSSLLNIDNTAPNISLELPLDDTRTSSMLFFSGQTTDNVGLEKLYIDIRSLDKNQNEIPSNLSHIDLIPDDIITRGIDLSELKDGFYNVEVTGEDAGGNISRVSRNVQLDKALSKARVDILYPLNNEEITGNFNIYGKITSEKTVDSIMLYIDDENVAQTTLTEAGYYRFAIEKEMLVTGIHKVKVRVILQDGEVVESVTNDLNYFAYGPWISIDSLAMGDFAINRPFLSGRTGYALTEEEQLLLDSKETSKEIKDLLKKKSVDYVDISFDNGRTFTEIESKKGNWEYRIENQDMLEGYHFMVVRSNMKDGTKALTRIIIQVDKTAPFIRLISPQDGGKYNQQIEFSGLSSDDVKLKNVNLQLRSGDKSSYEVPGFIQGLYFDVHALGATLFDVGVGLTFFDDNVKLQVQYGQLTDKQWQLFEKIEPKRYGGHVFGAKLLANIFYLPFSYFAGPDWAWLSASFAIGADFSVFTETQSGTPQMLSAVLMQLEFPRITSNNRKIFRTFSFYTEFQLWFASTDIDTSSLKRSVATFVPHITGGLRLNVF